ncbi:hypothetical protein DYU11_11730 [Fibrisoma montanum]|uniref:Uncharacterized protein n=2 Tax=Fibrisoma montanum TaxID=2305895 RepID=A0A418MBB5_9BACT|nr:hypothetical protein DYU11_11730 [Fibrisoma montanum]
MPSVIKLQHLTDLSKSDLAIMAAATVEYAVEGGHDTLALLGLATKLELYAAEVKKQAKTAALNELATYGKGGVAKAGVKLQLAEVGVSYDYTHDPVWQSRNADVTAAKSLLKDWEELLKKIPHGGMVISDPDTGEEYTAHPLLRTAEESIKASIL